MKKEIIVANNIDNIYDEINALIREKKTDVKKVVNDVYGMISAIGVRNVVENKVDFTKSRNLIVAAVILV